MTRLARASRLRRTLKRWPDELTADITAEMKAAAIILEATLENKAPKDEGNLARAATARVGKDGLGVTAGYSKHKPGFVREWKKGRGFTALFAEFGTSHHAAQPFIRATWRERVKGILDRVDGAVKRSLDKAKSS